METFEIAATETSHWRSSAVITADWGIGPSQLTDAIADVEQL
jgi:hypothetical protein